MEFRRFSSPVGRVFNKVKRNKQGCWIWCGHVSNSGSPLINDKGTMRKVTSILMGKLDERHRLGSHCGNPLCVNPDHLYVEDITQTRDPNRKCRHKLNPVQVKEIKRLFFEEGITNKELAKLYSVSPSSISQVVNKKSHKTSV